MPKQLNVNLAFTADTGKAAQGIKSLQQQLTELMNTAAKDSSSLGLTKNIKEATTAVAQLKAQLDNAMTSSGTLDLTKFHDSLQRAGMSLEDYRAKLAALGPEGTQAFSQLASQISSAEIPLRRANTLVQELGTTLMNTARWQLSSSLLHGFIGGLQHAYGYAQDLNESLNNIRIVTGQSTEQMAQLAQKANQAARELSTRTTDYTNASLIYYQQGLDDKAVEARTRTTLKLANVTRQSAEEVSNQMTAIWNNFDDGTKSLEYYADAITALGAKTASSSAEIAEGLSKFAAVADTIGLSYETATAALATVVAETRQSADTVGTAFKTLFSRIQSIKLGETLEDGVGLTKYTEAIKKAGVDVLDMNGKLREADDILADLGHRWEEIDKTQRTAVAQTVAGQRQYSQFMALMENWDKVEQNVQIAEGSEGTLQKQADIYAESWEASAKRVQASAEAIYDTLLDDKFFIGFNNLLSGVLDRVNDLIKGLGGIPGVLTTIGALLTKVFSTQISSNIDRIVNNITGASIKGAQARQQESINALQKQAAVAEASGSAQGAAQSVGLKAQADLQQTLIDNQKRYNQEQLQTAQNLLDNNAKLREAADLEGELLDQARQRSQQAKESEVRKARAAAKDDEFYDPAVRGDIDQNVEKLKQYENELQKVMNTQQQLQSTFTSFEMVLNNSKLSPIEKFQELNAIFEQNETELKKLINSVDQSGESFNKLTQAMEILKKDPTDGNFQAFKQVLDEIASTMTSNVKTSTEQLTATLRNLYGSSEEAVAACERLIEKFGAESEQGRKAAEALKVLKNDTDNARDSMNNMQTSALTLGQTLSGLSNLAMSLASVINSIKSAIEIWNDDDLNFGEKLLKTIPALLMSFSMLTNSITGAGLAALKSIGSHILLASGYVTEAAAASAAGTATTAFGIALKTVIPFLGKIAIAIGVVVAVAKLLSSLFSSGETLEEKLEKATEAADKSKEAFENAKTAADNLKASFDNYTSIREQLDNCKQGTEEWQEKLSEVNGQVQDLLQDFPELAKYVTNENGALTISEEGMAEVLNKARTDQYASYGQFIAAEHTKNQIEVEISKEAANEAFADVNAVLSSALEGYTTEQKDGFASLQTLIEGSRGDNARLEEDAEGNETAWDAIDAIIEAYKEGNTKADSSVYKDIAARDIIDHYRGTDGVNFDKDRFNKEQWEKYGDLDLSSKGLYELYQTDRELFNSLWSELEADRGDFQQQIDTVISGLTEVFESPDLLGAIDTYNNSIETSNTLQTAYAESLATMILSQDESFMANERATELFSAAAGKYSVLLNAKVQDIQNQSGEQLIEYFKNSSLDGKYVTQTSLDDKGNLTYQNKEGEDVVLTKEDLINYQAGAEASKELADSMEPLIKKTTELANSEDKADQAFGQFLERKDISIGGAALKKELENTGYTNERDAAITVLDEKIGNGNKILSNKEAKKYGFNSATEMIDAFLEGMEEYDINEEEAQDTGSKFLNRYYNKIKKENEDAVANLDFDEMKSMGNLLRQSMENGGYMGLSAMKDILSNTSDLSGTIAALTSGDITWAATSAQELSDYFTDLGISLDGIQEDTLQNLIDSMKQLSEISFESATATFASIHDIIDGVAKGDKIKAEDYEKLIELVGEDTIKDYFTPMADGTHKLTGDAEAFYNEVNKRSLEEFKQGWEQESQRAQNISELRGVNDEEKSTILQTQTRDNFDADVARKQLTYLDAVGAKPVTIEVNGKEKLISVQEILADLEEKGKGFNNLNSETFKALNTMMEQHLGDWDKLSEGEEQANKNAEDYVTMMVSSASDLQSLRDLFGEGEFDETGKSWEEIANKWKEIFSEDDIKESIKSLEDFENATEEVDGVTAITNSKTAWHDLKDQIKLTTNDLDKFVGMKDKISPEDFAEGIEEIAKSATNFEELDKVMAEAEGTGIDFTDVIINLLNQTGGTTEEKIKTLRNELELGNGKARELLKTMYELNSVNDSEQTTTEKIAENNQTNLDNQNDNKLSKEDKQESNKQAGLTNIDLIASADDMFDTDKISAYNEEMKKVRQGTELTVMESRQLGLAAAEIFKNADFLGTEKQVEKIKEAFADANGEIDESNLKAYADSIKDVILNAENLTLDQKLATIKKELIDAGVPAEYLKDEIKEILTADNNSTADALTSLNKMLENGTIDAKTYLALLKEIMTMNASSETPQQQMDALRNNQEEIEAAGKQDYLESGHNGMPSDVVQKMADRAGSQAFIDQAQGVVDSLTSSSFETPEAFIEFFDMLPEGVNYMSQLTDLFGSIADKVTSFDQLDKLGDLMSQSGAKDSDFANPENEGWQTAMDSARTSEAEDIGVDVDVFKNYEDAIYETIKAENDLLQSQGEVGRSEEALQVLSMKMTKSMMEQEKGFENLGSTLKKYDKELDNLDETSVGSTEALTNIQKACNQLFGGKVSKNFVKENLEDIKKAANNDQDALKRLQKEAAKDYASGLKEAKKAAASTTQETKNTVKAFNKLGSAMEDAFKDMENAEIGDDISDSFRQTLNDMLASGEMTTDEIAQLLSNMGYDTNFDSVTMGFDEATEIMKNKTDILGDYMSQGMDAALANLSDSAAAQLQNLVSQYEQAGYSEAEAMNAALNSVGTQLEVSEEQITADENAAATSQSTFEMKGTLTMPNGETSDFGANATVTTNTDGGGDADISIPVLGKGGAAFNGGGAGAGARTGGGGGGGGGGCFVAGTVVSIQSGFKNIEDIQIGDVVLSYNEQKKENEYSEVLQKFVHLIKDNIYTLYVGNDKLEVTGIHRFLITRNKISEWIHASDLQVGDLMQFADGTLHEIFQIDKEVKLKTVYNFEVSNNHNYYVGKNQVLAHNKGCFEAGTQITMRDYYKNIEDVKPGDIVLSYNEKTNKNEYSEVLQTMIHLVKEEIYSLYIEDDVLFATGIHRFLITRNGIRGWVEASNLQIGDLVQFADGTLHKINDIKVEIKIKTVYNFEVSNNHNYYVGKNQILAHNKGRGSRGGRNRPTTVRKAAAEEVHTEDRYHKLDKTLERLNKQYEDINKAKDHAFGGKHIAALNREIELQKELNKTNEDYLAKIQEYKNKDLSLLTGKLGNKDSSKWSSFGDVAYQSTSVDYGTKTKKKKGKVVKDKKGNAVKTKDKKKIVETESTQYAKVGLADLGINVDTNEFGQITNIDQVNAKIDEFYNKGAKAYAKNYNANLKDDASLSEKQANAKAQNAWNRVQAITEAARKWVEQYEEDVTLEMDKISEIIDGKVKEQELRLEKAQYVVEIRAEMDENSLNVINFALDMMGDKARTATSRIAKLGESLKVLTKDYSSGTSDRISGIQELLDGIATKANEGSFTDNDNKVWKFNQADFDASKSIGQATNDKGENTLQQMMKYGKNATDAINSIAQSGIISSDQIKWMVEQSQTELENVKKVKEVREQIFGIIQSTWDEYSEKFDKILEKQEKYMNMTKGIQNVVNLVGRSNFGFQDDGEDVEADKRRTARQKGRDLEASIDENLKKQANNRIKAYRLEQAEITKILQKNEEQRNKVKKAMDDKEKAGTLTDEAKEEYMQELDAYDAIIESMNDKLNEAAQNEQAAFEEALQTNLDAYGREMERAADAFQESMAKGAYSIDLLAESMDRYIKTHSTLVPEYEKIHQLRLMDLEAEKAINQATDPKIKRELLAIQDEITAATSKDAKMSEYELTYLRQKLELKQAEAALEDAQKAKTQVSLTRDNEGNFGYVYTADDNNVADAEKNYSDKIYEMQKANAEYIQDLQNQLVTAEQEYYQKMQEISTNMALSPEARRAQMASIDEDYNTLHEALTNQLATALTAGNDIYGQYSDQYAEITGDITAQNLEHVGSFEETLLSIKTGFASWDEYTATWKSSHEAYFGEAVSVLDNFASVNETTFAAAGTTMKEFSEGADEQLKSYTASTGEAVESTGELKSAIEQLGEEAASQFDSILEKLEEIENPFLGYLGTMEQAAQNLADALIEVQDQMMAVQALEQATVTQRQTRRDRRRTTKTKPTPQKKAQKDIGKKNRRTGRYTRRTLVVKQSNLRRALRKLDARKSKAALTRKEERRALSDYKRANKIKSRARLTQRQKDAAYKKAAKTKVKELLNSYKKVVVHYDTGGYTGEWSGNEGRLAVLHSKELILNQSDTQNLLSAVNMIRGISERIDLNALAQSGALSNGFSSGINGVSSGTLEQDVHITAEFPNATDRNEITEAFNNIIGLAAQYANK